MALIDDLREKITVAAGKLAAHKEELADAEKRYKKLLTTEEKLDKVRAVLQRAAQLCQQNVEAHFSDIVTEALSTVFGEYAYQFRVEYVIRNNATECDLYFVDEVGNQRDPLDSCGLGAADIAATALRFAYLQLEGRTQFLLADEPGRQLDAERAAFFSDFLKQACDELGIQMVIITHDVNNLAQAADRLFKVKMVDPDKRISKVKEMR